MNIYLVRHGESGANAMNIVQGAEAELTDLGIRQAETLAERFRSIPVDVIYASPAERAFRTASIIGSAIGQDVIPTNILQEKGRPSEVVGKKGADPAVRKVMQLMDEHRTDPLWHYSDEENFFDLKKRCEKVVSWLEDMSEQNVLCVTHSHLLYCLVGVMNFGDLFSPDVYNVLYRSFLTKNTGITMCEYTKERGWKLHTWNDHAHLGSIAHEE